MTNKPKMTKEQAKIEMWRRGILSWKLKPHQKDLYDLFHKTDHKVQTWLLARRCLAEGTLIKTPYGLKTIESLKPGDEVFGYNIDGSISLTTIKQVFYNGEKEVVDISNNGRVLETCTLDHVWLTKNEYNEEFNQRQTKDIKKHNKIVRKYINLDDTYGINEPHAYAIAALLGNGSGTSRGNRISISAPDQHVPVKIAEMIGAYSVVKDRGNYSWHIRGKQTGNRQYASIDCHYYNEWCKDKLAHEKYVDLDVIKSWNKTSQLNFLAGLIDTDGSVFTTKDNCLVISIEMQSKSTIEAFQYIVHNHFQYKANISVVNRDTLVNGPVYSIKIKNNQVTKTILKEIDKYLIVSKRKWKRSYEKYQAHNSNTDHVGVSVSNPRIMRCYDIHVSNETNLYLTANGLVTHNCGKTVTLALLAIEACIKSPNTIIKFLSPTKIQVNTNLRPIMRMLLEDCPPDLKPEFKQKDYVYYFPNGSEIQLAGSESGHIEKLRGGYSHISIIDEAQDVSDLDNAVKAVLLPTTLTTNGKVLLAGTPPKDFEHDFCTYVEDAEHKGSLVKKNIFENTMLSKEDIDKIIEDSGGIDSEYVRREYLCEIIKDSKYTVIPEFTKDLKREIVKEWPKPPHYDPYVSMDIGFKDLTALLFGYYDFRADKIIIEDEIVVTGTDLQINKLTDSIKEKEHKLWMNIYTNELIKPHLRVSDINYIVTQEISNYSGKQIQFVNARKDDKEAAINVLRMMLSNKKIIIDPKCTNLIRHLENVKWDKSKTSKTFARSVDSGHYDCVDALIYLIRSIDFSRNPYPRSYGMDLRKQDVFYSNPDFKNDNSNLDIYKKLFGRKGK